MADYLHGYRADPLANNSHITNPNSFHKYFRFPLSASDG
jgi:hypothetical protein